MNIKIKITTKLKKERKYHSILKNKGGTAFLLLTNCVAQSTLYCVSWCFNLI